MEKGLKSKKVYVVTGGSYSSYRITGVFSSRKLAQQYIDEHRIACKAASNEGLQTDESLWDDADQIEVWSLDDMAGLRAAVIYRVCIRLTDGASASRYTDEGSRAVALLPAGFSHQSRISGPWAVGLSTVSVEHAHKLAVEARQAYLRKKTEHL